MEPPSKAVNKELDPKQLLTSLEKSAVKVLSLPTKTSNGLHECINSNGYTTTESSITTSDNEEEDDDDCSSSSSSSQWEYYSDSDENEDSMLAEGLIKPYRTGKPTLTDPYCQDICLNLHTHFHHISRIQAWIQKLMDQDNNLGKFWGKTVILNSKN